MGFLGQEQCTIDGNGRVKLPPGYQRTFDGVTRRGEVVLHLQIPEGCVAVLPPAVWEAMRRQQEGDLARVGTSMLERRKHRQFGAFSHHETISNQGRITIPPLFREYADLLPGGAAILIGCDEYLEIWTPERWLQEAVALREHVASKVEQELAGDLVPVTAGGTP